MEVHAHTHPPSGGTHKKWTHYFWEFLMLFLAVFCGFLAEYQLEHKIEKDREKQYMQSMVEDLKSDTALLANNIAFRKQRVIMVDSLVELLNSPQRSEKGNEIYYLGRTISPPINIFPNNGTLEQLKSSGNLRLIKKKDISSQIMAYDQQLRNVLFEMGDEVGIRGEYRQLAVKVFNTVVFNDMTREEKITLPTNNPQLYSSDPSLINQFIGAAQYLKRVNHSQTIRTERLLQQAKLLMEQIKKEYHLK